MSAWRPVPWIAAVLGLFGTGLGLLYVQRPWFALAYVCASVGGALGFVPRDHIVGRVVKVVRPRER